jgi:hypothetical protein
MNYPLDLCPPYTPVGRCIYCLKSAAEAGMKELQPEHIIPYSLAGRGVLPEASCEKCAEHTGAADGWCAGNLLRTVRTHFAWRSRHSKRPKALRVWNEKRRSWRDVPVEEHPPYIMLPGFGTPAALFNERDPPGRVKVHGIKFYRAPDFEKRTSLLRPGERLIEPFELGPFCRMLAKLGTRMSLQSTVWAVLKPFFHRSF